MVAGNYVFRITTVACLTMLTLKTILKTLFILNFNRMISISEEKVLKFFYAITSTCTLVYLMQEIIRHTLGINYFARGCFNIYAVEVGAIYRFQVKVFLIQKNMDNARLSQSITLGILTIPLLALFLSLFIFYLVRSQKNKVSLIQKYQNNITQSSDNGLSNVAVLFALICIFTLLFGGSKAIQVKMVFMQQV